MRLDAYLAAYWPEISRAQWHRYVEAGRVKVNGNVIVSPKKMLGEDDEVVVEIPPTSDYSQHTLPVIFEDDNVIVINKPTGVLTHAKGAPLDEFTVSEFMRSRTSDKPDGNRPGIVHRLDRDTSGVIICCKNPLTQSFLQKQFSDKKVKKSYIALLEQTPDHHEAILKLPIERNPQKPQTFRVGAQGKPSETHYKVRETYDNGMALVELRPVTGRTHQLRVHMAYLHCPIVGDRFYGKDKIPHTRLFLHAASLEITIPGGERKIFEAPIPADFQIMLNKLRI